MTTHSPANSDQPSAAPLPWRRPPPPTPAAALLWRRVADGLVMVAPPPSVVEAWLSASRGDTDIPPPPWEPEAMGGWAVIEAADQNGTMEIAGFGDDPPTALAAAAASNPYYRGPPDPWPDSLVQVELTASLRETLEETGTADEWLLMRHPDRHHPIAHPAAGGIKGLAQLKGRLRTLADWARIAEAERSQIEHRIHAPVSRRAVDRMPLQDRPVAAAAAAADGAAARPLAQLSYMIVVGDVVSPRLPLEMAQTLSRRLDDDVLTPASTIYVVYNGSPLSAYLGEHAKLGRPAPLEHSTTLNRGAPGIGVPKCRPGASPCWMLPPPSDSAAYDDPARLHSWFRGEILAARERTARAGAPFEPPPIDVQGPAPPPPAPPAREA